MSSGSRSSPGLSNTGILSTTSRAHQPPFFPALAIYTEWIPEVGWPGSFIITMMRTTLNIYRRPMARISEAHYLICPSQLQMSNLRFKGYVPFPRSHTWSVSEPRFKPRSFILHRTALRPRTMPYRALQHGAHGLAQTKTWMSMERVKGIQNRTAEVTSLKL